MRTLRFLLAAALLSGCGAQTSAGDAACCNAPAPGTVTVHVNGQVGTAIGGAIR
jgi:hypothetical protein